MSEFGQYESNRATVARRALLTGAGVAAAMPLLAIEPAMAVAVEGPPFAKTENLPVNVKEHGAKGDGETDDWKPIQSAIDDVADAGGGRSSFQRGLMRFPPGLR